MCFGRRAGASCTLTFLAVIVAASAHAQADSTEMAAREEAARAELRPICSDKALRDEIVAEAIAQGGAYERDTTKWDLDEQCGQVDLPVAPLHDTADTADSASHSSWIYDARWSPDGKLIATAGRDGTVRVWDVATGKSVKMIDITKLQPRMKSQNGSNPGHVRSARFLDDGRSLVVAADLHPVRIFDIGTGAAAAEVPYSIPDPKSEVAPVIATTASGLIVLQGFGGDLVVYDTKTKAERYRLPAIGSHAPLFAVSDAGGFLATTRPGKDRSVIIELRKLDTGASIWSVEAAGSISVASITFSRDGKQLAAAVDGKAFVYATADKSLTATVMYYPSFGGGLDIAFTADGKKLITGCRHAQLWDIATGGRVHHFGPFRDLLHAVDVSPDGKYLATGHIGSDGRIWEIETGKFFRRLGKNVYPPG